MTIEIKVTGTDAAETVQQFLGLAGYFNGAHASVTGSVSTVAVSPALTVVNNTSTPVTVTVADDEEETGVTPTATVDKDGIPFDARIHSSAKEPFKADGTWKRRKNLSDDDYNRVYAELKARVSGGAPAPVIVETPVAAPAPTAAPVEAPAPAPQVVADAAPVVNIQALAPQPTAAPVAPAPAPVAPAPIAAPATGKTHQDLQVTLSKTLGALMGKLPDGQNATEVLKSLLASYNVSGMPQIPADKIDECYDRMQRMIADPANAATIAVGLA